MTTPPAVPGKARKPQQRLTGKARRNVSLYAAMAYRRGDSLRTIAAATRRSYGNIRTLLTEEGVPLRKRGGSHSAGPTGPALESR